MASFDGFTLVLGISLAFHNAAVCSGLSNGIAELSVVSSKNLVDALISYCQKFPHATYVGAVVPIVTR